MQRVLHYRIHGLPDHRLERLHEQFEELAKARTWRCDQPWIASAYSRDLFAMEYVRLAHSDVKGDLSAAGFVKMAGDETDALIITKVEGERILFYPPAFRLHSQSPPSPEWAYALYGIRAYAPTLMEAEQEALKILRGFGHLGH